MTASRKPRAQDMLTAVFDELGRFRRGMPFHDGITLVVVKIEKMNPAVFA